MTLKWQKIQEQTSLITDSLGTPIDPNIKNTVIAFNNTGLNTVASCEGHLDHGLPYPWIDLSPFSDNDPILKQKRALVKKIFESDNQTNPSEKKQLVKLEKTIDIEMAQYAKKTISILKMYSQANHKDRQERIIVICYPEFIRIQPQSGCIQILRSSNEQAKMLKIFQKEFENLSNFLPTSHL